MEEQDSILNEFLERIKAKEKSNEELRQKIVKKKEELTKINIELTKPINPESNKIIISKKLFSEKEGEIASQKALHNYNSLKYSKSDINDNCIERIIEYITTEQISNLYIMGDFTKWEPYPMNKNKDIFSYKIILLKGFKYYYSFQTGDQILFDYNSPYEENPRTLQIQNYIDLNEANHCNAFDFVNDMNILKTVQENYFLSHINMKDDEFLYLSKLKHHGERSKEITKEAKEKKFKLFSSINSYYDQLYRYVNPVSNFNKIKMLRLYLKNRIIAKINDDKTTSYFKIHTIADNYIFHCLKLYDNNHIKINADYYYQSYFFFNILPKSITTIPITPDSKLYHLLSLEESQKILEDYKKDDKSILKAYFKTLLNLKNNATSNQQNQNYDLFSYRRNMILVTPYKIEPQGIKIDDYEFYYSLNRITKVRNKKEGSEVMYYAVDESIEKSKRPNRFEIYYRIINGKINLIHCHVLDKDLRESKLIIKELQKNEDPHVLKKGEEYIKNKQLLLITQGQNILKLYYQGKKVKMLAEKIEENKLYLLQSSNPDSIFNRMYVTVQNFSEKLQYDLIEQCNKFSYSFENMLNGVDVKVSFDNQKNFVIEPMMLSTSPCLLKKIASYDEHILKQKIPKPQVQKPEIKNEFEKLNVMTEMEKYFSIAQKMVQLRKYKNKENIEKMSNEDKNKLINELNEYSKAMQIILVYIEENEMWENIDEAASISSEIDEILKMLNTK